MKTHKLLVPVITLGLLVASCSKSSEPAPLTPTQAKASFNAVNTDLSGELNSLNNAPGSTALTALTGSAGLSGTGSPFSRISSPKPQEVIRQVSAGMVAIRKVLFAGSASARVEGDKPFIFSEKKGIYNWDHVNHQYVKSQVASSVVEINYPTAGPDSDTNDAKFQLTDYAEKSTPNGDQLYSPTLVKATVTIASVKQVEINVTMSYDVNDSPSKGNISVYVNPYTETIIFDNSSPTAVSASVDISKSGKTIIGWGGSFTFANQDAKDQFSPSTATAYVQLMNVRFTAVLDPNSSSNNPSDAIKITITVDGGVAGTVVMVQDPNNPDNQIPYIKYNDGTQEKLEVVFADLKTQLDGFGVN